MSYIITNVPSYKPWNRDGAVVDQVTGLKRKFETKEAARAFIDLSHYGTGPRVQELR